MRSSPKLGAAALTVLLVVAAWPIAGAIAPRAALDPSWQLGLHFAANEGLNFGTDVVFTYGPLGFLKTWDTAYIGTWTLTMLYQAALLGAIAATALSLLRRSLGLVLAVPVTYLVLVLAQLDPATILAAIVAIAVLSRDPAPGPRAQLVFAAGAGAFAGLESLGKISTGAAVVFMALVACAGLPGWRRNVPVYAASGLVTAVGLWLLTGQSLADFDDYLLNSAAVASGYAEVLMTEAGGAPDYAAALVVVVAGAAVLWSTGATAGRDARIPLLGVWAVLTFFSFKAGFVRHNQGHVLLFFWTLLGALAGVAWWRLERGTALAVLGLAFVAALPSTLVRSDKVFNPIDGAERARWTVEDLLGGGAEETRELGRRQIIAETGVTPPLIRAAREGSVHVEPWQIAVAWAHGLDWRPLPVFQSYTAYTPALDELNADRLAGGEGPDRVLMSPPAASDVDGRYAPFDSPRATKQLLCRYRPLERDSRWVLLERSADRCGRERVIARSRTGWGRPVRVPAPRRPDSAIGVRAKGVGVEGVESLRKLLFRSYERHIVLVPGRTHRIVPSAPESGLLLRSNAGFDYPAPFGMVPQAKTFILRKLGGDQGGEPLELEFFELPARR